MCGLVAVLSRHGPPPRAALEAALAAIGRRGPDGRSSLLHDGIGLAHARLAMTGGPSGVQPIRRGAHAIVTNGEVYGHGALRAALEGAGHTFGSTSDAEVALVAHAHGGEAALAELRGELALVIAELDAGTLTAFRDRFGIRPLVYAEHEGRVWIASKAAALFAAGVPARFGEEALDQVLSMQYLRPGQTLFEGVRALEPGAVLTADAQGVRVRSLVRPRFAAPGNDAPRSTEEAAERLRALLTEAVRERLTADQPLGFQLSGGLDSSAILGLAAQLGVCKPRALTVVFGPPPVEVDELPHARAMAAAVGAELETIEVTPEHVVAHLGDALAAGETPSIDAHVVAKWMLAQRARGLGLAGLLTGEGADEVFAGYAHLVAEEQAAPTHDPSIVGMHLPEGEGLDTRAVGAALSFVPRWWQAKATLGARVRTLLSDAWLAAPRPDPFARTMASLHRAPEPLDRVERAQETWCQLALAGYILPAVGDGPELAHGVEGRIPFLDPRVVDAVWSWPRHLRRPPGEEKGLLRRALVGVLPEPIRLRPKHPFVGPPLFARSAHAREHLWAMLEREACAGGVLAPDAVARAQAALASPDPRARRAWEPALFLVLSLAVLREVTACAPAPVLGP